MARLVVSTQSMHVLASDRNVFSVLGYHPHEINCRSILAVTGKGSDLRMLQNAIQDMQGQKMQLVLYDASGGERRLIACCSPFHQAGVFVGCLLNLHSSEAIPLLNAFEDCAQARALVSADSPHVIHMANDAFFGRFGCTRSEVLGRPLNLAYGYLGADAAFLNCSLAAQLRADSDAAWTALLHVALDGRVARRPVAASSGGLDEDGITCVPVVEAPNGRIRNLLITFGPILSRTDEENDPDNGQALNILSHTTGKTACPPSKQASAGYAVRSRARNSEAVVFPRRRPYPDASLATQAEGQRAPAVPVIVTRELVATLADLPLRKAAATAGISPTAFKRACRKLGVRRWTYKRCRPAEPVKAGAGDDGGASVDGSCKADSDWSAELDGERRPDSDSAALSFEPDLGDSCGASRRDDPWTALLTGDPATAFALVGMAAAAAADAFLGLPAVEYATDDALARDVLGMSWPM